MFSTSNIVLQCILGVEIVCLCAIDLDRDILACQRVGGLLPWKTSAGIIIPGKAENPRDLMVLSAKPPCFIKASWIPFPWRLPSSQAPCRSTAMCSVRLGKTWSQLKIWCSCNIRNSFKRIRAPPPKKKCCLSVAFWARSNPFPQVLQPLPVSGSWPICSQAPSYFKLVGLMYIPCPCFLPLHHWPSYWLPSSVVNLQMWPMGSYVMIWVCLKIEWQKQQFARVWGSGYRSDFETYPCPYPQMPQRSKIIAPGAINMSVVFKLYAGKFEHPMLSHPKWHSLHFFCRKRACLRLLHFAAGLSVTSR